jgi:hypothetical protein
VEEGGGEVGVLAGAVGWELAAGGVGVGLDFFDVHVEEGGFHADRAVQTQVDLGQAFGEAGFDGALGLEVVQESG